MTTLFSSVMRVMVIVQRVTPSLPICLANSAFPFMWENTRDDPLHVIGEAE